MNAGAVGVERAVFRSIMEQRMKVHKDGWNVTTFQHRDVPTSRRPHIVTPQRRDVGSTNIKVNKRQHRDVSASFASQSLKQKGDQNSRHRGSYELGHKN